MPVPGGFGGEVMQRQSLGEHRASAGPCWGLAEGCGGVEWDLNSSISYKPEFSAALQDREGAGVLLRGI